MEHRIESKKNKFLKLTPENDKFNQYWFSEKTIEFLLKQVTKSSSERIGFIATPSLFFSLPPEQQSKAYLFDIDEKLTKKHKNGRCYDFNEANFETFADLQESFDFLVIDPPFITEEAWAKFASFAKYLKKEKCRILACSIKENEERLKRLLNMDIKVFKPSIPHLVYQYNCYANYEDEELNKVNEEIGAE